MYTIIMHYHYNYYHARLKEKEHSFRYRVKALVNEDTLLRTHCCP